MSDTPLSKKLRRLIEANGPMSIADYMAHCLGDPEHGYYTTRDPFGARGDFITAPEVSQMFGEILGAWLIETWRMTGSPSPFRLVELGPGRGTLMADIIRVAKKAPDFSSGVTVHLVDTSPVLKARQAEALAAGGTKAEWHSSFTDVPRGPLFLVANEFFDTLPIRQFVRIGGAWRERVIGLDVEERLALGIGAGRLRDISEAATPSRSLLSASHPVNFDLPAEGRLRGSGGERDILEVRPTADALIAEIARRIVEDNGAALIVDYGYEGPAFGDSLQAVRGHEHVDPLEAPGEADLTAHVDFSALARRARTEGAAVHGPISQGEFLLSLGLLERAGRLGANADEATRAALHSAVERLAGPDRMGTLFKAMAITRPGIPPPPFRG